MNGGKRLRTLVALIALLGALALGTGACSSKSKDASSSTTTGASSTTTGASSTAGQTTAGQTIEIKDFAFHDAKLTVARGAHVTVSNKDGTAHTLTADGKAFDTGNVAGGATATLDLPTAGTFAYHCAIHNYMTGEITVTG